MTFQQGNSLSDSFGHSAIRVQDKSKNYDLVFNYGVYDFNDPNFYSNFIKGYLNYMGVKNIITKFEKFQTPNEACITHRILIVMEIVF